ncbi:MAG TPA: CRTAC1 family protein [Capsulimonadaceae bacterium]|nr:CRTAC1 family protein [Capsulimonadaceae bacterium]
MQGSKDGKQEPSQARSSTIRFVDNDTAAGIAYRWQLPEKRPLNILQTIGNGCAFLDYNNDGNLDILLIGDKLALYKGDGHGHFADITHQTGLDKLHGTFLGCAVGDYDNDGYDDIYLTAFRGGALLHNEAGKSFKDVTKEAGIAPQPWGSSASFADMDGDGKLDLYICNYVRFGPDVKPQMCPSNGIMTACPPQFYKPLKGVLYHNLGSGKFQDVTSMWRAEDVSGNALGVAIADYDGSGKPGIAIANDELRGDLLHEAKSAGSIKFDNLGAASGVGYSSDGSPQAGMGIDWGDYDDDGKLDLAVTTFENQTKPIYRQEDAGSFEDEATNLGITSVARSYLSFGVKWADFDNDGWLDLIMASGHTSDNVAQFEPDHTFLQPLLLFYNENGRHFSSIGAQAGAVLQKPIMGRGLAIGDYDNDGRMDALVVDNSGSPVLLHNETPDTRHWLEVNLVGTKSNRDGIGAIVVANAGGKQITRLCHTDGSYMSASDKRVHIGLGAATSVQSLAVHWPSGHTDTYQNVSADEIVTLQEGSSAVEPFHK